MLTRLKDTFSGFSLFVTIIQWLMIIGGFITWIALASNSEELLGFIIGGSIIAGGILLSVYYMISGYFYFAAADKGYKDLAYLVIPFFFGMVGYLLVCALPNKGAVSEIVEEELPEI